MDQLTSLIQADADKHSSSKQKNLSKQSSSVSFYSISDQDDEDDDEEDIDNKSFQSDSSDNKKFDLYKYLADPNPLMKKEYKEDYSFNTAINIKFKKLPSFYEELRQVQSLTPIVDNGNINTQEELAVQKENNLKAEFASTSTPLKLAISQEVCEATTNVTNSQEIQHTNLHTIYKDNQKAKLVYKKYEDAINQKYFASQIFNLRGILNKNKLTTDQNFLTKQNYNEINYHKPDDISLSSNDLIFDSRFECGNLFCAYKVDQNEYDLVLQNDINTKGNTQWFFFSIQNTKCQQTAKKTSLFNQGMKPAVFSNLKKANQNIGWTREGKSITYFQNKINREYNSSLQYYTLSFSYTFSYDQDCVYFAYTFPYTYTDLNTYLDNIQNDTSRNLHISRKVLCKTVANNNLDMLTITQNSVINRDSRKGVSFIARQHPGEVPGSFMVEGIIDYLTEDTIEAQYLRESCVFKIVPMLNVDGVIHGNNRCSLSGVDLNRTWKEPNKKLQPCVYFAKNMIKKFGSQKDMKLLIDFHGHSKKMNAFFYGNSYINQPETTRVFPLLMSQNEQKVSYNDCRFKVERCFEQTARIALWRQLRIPCVYTLEASFYGYSSAEDQKCYHFTPNDYKQIGRSVCTTLLKILLEENKEGPQHPLSSTLISIYANANKGAQKSNSKPILQSAINDIKQNIQDIDDKQSFSGSDSEPSQDELDQETLDQILPKRLQKRRKRKKKKSTDCCQSKKLNTKQDESQQDLYKKPSTSPLQSRLGQTNRPMSNNMNSLIEQDFLLKTQKQKVNKEVQTQDSGANNYLRQQLYNNSEDNYDCYTDQFLQDTDSSQYDSLNLFQKIRQRKQYLCTNKVCAVITPLIKYKKFQQPQAIISFNNSQAIASNVKTATQCDYRGSKSLYQNFNQFTSKYQMAADLSEIPQFRLSSYNFNGQKATCMINTHNNEDLNDKNFFIQGQKLKDCEINNYHISDAFRIWYGGQMKDMSTQTSASYGKVKNLEQNYQINRQFYQELDKKQQTVLVSTIKSKLQKNQRQFEKQQQIQSEIRGKYKDQQPIENNNNFKGNRSPRQRNYYSVCPGITVFSQQGSKQRKTSAKLNDDNDSALKKMNFQQQFKYNEQIIDNKANKEKPNFHKAMQQQDYILNDCQNRLPSQNAEKVNQKYQQQQQYARINQQQQLSQVLNLQNGLKKSSKNQQQQLCNGCGGGDDDENSNNNNNNSRMVKNLGSISYNYSTANNQNASNSSEAAMNKNFQIRFKKSNNHITQNAISKSIINTTLIQQTNKLQLNQFIV